MNFYIKKNFKNITPVFVLTSAGLILSLGEIAFLLLSNDKTEATVLLGILAAILYAFFLADRYLTKKVKYKRVLVIEFIFLIFLPFLYLYINKDTNIYVDTQKKYFILLYDNNGLKREQIPSSGLFDHAITYYNDSIINIHYSLYNDNNVQVLEPKSWGGFKAKYLDTIINSNKIEIEMRSNNLSNNDRDSIFKKLLPTLYLQKTG